MDQDDNCFRKEDREELLKQGWQLNLIQKALSDIKDTAKVVADRAEFELSDLEKRVRSLENFKWIIWGAGTVIIVLIGWTVTLLTNVIPHK